MMLVPTPPPILCMKSRRQKEVKTADAFLASTNSFVIAEVLEMQIHSKYYSKEHISSESLRGHNFLSRIFLVSVHCKRATRVLTDVE